MSFDLIRIEKTDFLKPTSKCNVCMSADGEIYFVQFRVYSVTELEKMKCTYEIE